MASITVLVSTAMFGPLEEELNDGATWEEELNHEDTKRRSVDTPASQALPELRFFVMSFVSWRPAPSERARFVSSCLRGSTFLGLTKKHPATGRCSRRGGCLSPRVLRTARCRMP